MGIVRPLAVVAVAGVLAWLGYDKLAETVPLPASIAIPLPVASGADALPPDGQALAVEVPAADGGEDASAADGETASPERRFARALDDAAELARELVRLGETKSRNLPEIVDEQRRMTARLDEIDGLIASGALPADTADAVAAYQSGALAIREAMDRAQKGLVRLDFGAVKAATERMRDGERDLSRAARLLPD